MRPSLRFERQLLRAGCARIAGIDEVGRGAIAGPVAVGVAVVTAANRSAPQGLRDSKLLTPQQREALFPRLQRWACDWAVGQASAGEVDTWGLTAALRLAALRALQQVPPVDAVVLDGSHDYLTSAAETLFEVVPWPQVPVPAVHRVIKGDRTCSSVAAASVLAKVTRDAVMTRLHERYPGYCWDLNKGYTTPEHSSAVRLLGLCAEHRRSWQVAAALAHGLPAEGPIGNGLPPGPSEEPGDQLPPASSDDHDRAVAQVPVDDRAFTDPFVAQPLHDTTNGAVAHTFGGQDPTGAEAEGQRPGLDVGTVVHNDPAAPVIPS